MKALILAAGYATRLYPDTLNTPKPLLTVGGRTIADQLLLKLAVVRECDEVAIVTNQKFYSHFETWAASREATNEPFSVRIINDGTTTNETRLGPIGDICLALDAWPPVRDVLILAGDNLFSGDLLSVLAARATANASVLCVRRLPSRDDLRGKFGVVEADDSGWVRGFEEKPDEPKSNLAATAIYLVRAQDRPVIQALNTKVGGDSNAGDLVRALLQANVPMKCVEIGDWFDIGTHAELQAARERYCS